MVFNTYIVYYFKSNVTFYPNINMHWQMPPKNSNFQITIRFNINVLCPLANIFGSASGNNNMNMNLSGTLFRTLKYIYIYILNFV